MTSLPPTPIEKENGSGPVFNHQTVLPVEAVGALNVEPAGLYVDGTMGGGGHSRLILAALGPQGRLLALDRDPVALAFARDTWAGADPRVTVFAGNFVHLPEILRELGLGPVNGILLDLGLSSHQLFHSGRGFAFAQAEEPLDMRMDPQSELTAATVVNTWPEKELADIFYHLGEERASRRVAAAVVRARQKAPLATTGQLAQVALTALWRPGRPPKIHPATKIFMALRILVNDELGALKEFLVQAPGQIKTGGRLAIISFHSLEDRLVKEAFRQKNETGRGYFQPLFKKPQIPGPEELAANPRARSAKLRAAERSDLEYHA